MQKKRLDLLLVDKQLASSQDEASVLIRLAKVIVNNEKITKPGTPTKIDAVITVLKDKKEKTYVSRGALKLESGINAFEIDIKNKVCLDVGQSTGGFSDYLLKHGARFVIGVDVAYGIVDLALRDNPKCLVIERTNARHLSKDSLVKTCEKKKYPSHLVDDISLVVMDVSFISITKVLPAIKASVPNACDYIVLLKPQFEASKNSIPEGGVIQDEQVIQDTFDRCIHSLKALGFTVKNSCKAQLKGSKGNQEFLLHLSL